MKLSNLIKIVVISGVISCISYTSFSQQNIALIADDLLTSHVSPWEDLYAINNDIDPESSGDKTGGAYGNWNYEPSYNTWAWVEYNWDQLYMISQSDIYWWGDGQGIVIPYETYQEYWDFLNNQWVPLPDVVGNGVEADQYNVTTFTPVLTNKIRVHMISTICTGILEWKVWGELGEQVPVGTSIEIDQPLAKNSTSEILVTAKDRFNNPVEGYVFKLDIDIKNELSNIIESYTIDGVEYTSDATGYELSPTAATGEIAFSVAVPADIDYRDGLSLQVFFNNGNTSVGDPYSIYEPGLTPPDVISDDTDNTVDYDISLTFTDDPGWRAAIKNIYSDGELLETPADYVILSGEIILKSSGGNTALTIAGTKSILIEAAGYEDVTMEQVILPGDVDAGKSNASTESGLYRPTNTNIIVKALDQYGNPIEGYSFKYDIHVINNDDYIDEVYGIDGSDVDSDLPGQVTGTTGASGTIYLPLSIPRSIDGDDGIEITFKLNDDTPIPETIQYINDGTEKEIVLQNAVRNNAGFSWNRTAQSDNFIVYWGEKIVGDPTDEVNGNLSFDPQNILQILEDLLSYFVDTVHFITNADSLNMARYKHEVVMNETWNSGFTGWAFGGWADEKIGGMWIHPGATNGPAVLAHEFTHMNQCMVFLQYPGYGLNMPYSGFFWESHANFMMKTYTDTYTGVQPERYIFTSMMQFSTTRRHYQNIYFMDYLVDKYGFDTVSDIWRKADPNHSHPLTSLRDSVLRYSQDDLNDDIGYHAMRNVTWDYSSGDKIRSAIRSVDPIYVERMYTIPDSVVDEPGTFAVPEYLAPGDYGYNIIPLYPDESVSEIELQFDGLDNYEAGGAGWRYGFVALDDQGVPRYSTLYSDQNRSVTFGLQASDDAVYFVVTGAPQEHHNYPWEPGYPKVYRYPYTFQIQGAIPAGHKPGYNSMKDEYPGAPHSNGGGWVASTATVDASAYVGPNSQVLGEAQVLDNARIEGFAIVTDNSIVRNSAIVRDHAIVGRGSTIAGNAIVEKSARVYLNSSLSDHAVATGSALLYNTTLEDKATAMDLSRLSNVTLTGTAIAGGDAEEINGCSSGTYLQMQSKRTTDCDGEIEHDSNLEVNPSWSVYTYPKGERPAAPENLQASDVTLTSLTVTWDKAMDYREVESYYLYIDGEFTEIVDGTSISLAGLTAETTYSFAVKALDRSGNVSELSETIDVTTTITDIQEEKSFGFRVYPNPVNEVVYFESSLNDETHFVITDVMGRTICNGDFFNSYFMEKQHIGPAGIYYVTLSGKGKRYVTRILIPE